MCCAEVEAFPARPRVQRVELPGSPNLPASMPRRKYGPCVPVVLGRPKWRPPCEDQGTVREEAAAAATVATQMASNCLGQLVKRLVARGELPRLFRLSCKAFALPLFVLFRGSELNDDHEEATFRSSSYQQYPQPLGFKTLRCLIWI
ncbi:hypothetical protein NDU88_003033 [Pleurodeles waltl]|uniref:Uncharacterized protein n=1 Tax=Pleurodeles waltl TaxID=8319 RepID=A0AAV7LHG4_PLEWA|nr:hypothetical protein NDU88_003033 [Pleurodeles waltl]